MQSLITSAVLVVLGALSVVTWTIGILKFKEFRRALRDDECLKNFDWTQVLKDDISIPLSSDLATLRKEIIFELSKTHNTSKSFDNLLKVSERKLAQKIDLLMKVYERGHSELATIASSAPFIGLFGTVWGIMEALKSISLSGSVTIETVAGPVGEALITTAIGIATALPAVYFHNYIARQLQLRLAHLEQFSSNLINALIERS